MEPKTIVLGGQKFDLVYKHDEEVLDVSMEGVEGQLVRNESEGYDVIFDGDVQASHQNPKNALNDLCARMIEKFESRFVKQLEDGHRKREFRHFFGSL